MKEIFKVISIITLFVLAFISGLVLAKHHYKTEPEDIIITHNQAMEMCDELGLIYDYEAEGTTTKEFCYEDEQ